MGIVLETTSLDGVLGEIKAHAEKNELSLQDLEAMAAGEREVAGDTPGFSCFFNLFDSGISEGELRVKVVYTIEQHRENKYRHLSMSMGGHLPSVAVVVLVMGKLGFERELTECILDFSEGVGIVNIMEEIE